jgi:predicted transcriptional regulator
VLHVDYVETSQVAAKQNLTIQLDPETIRKAKVLAAKRGTSVGALVAAQIQESVQAEDAYESARRAAFELLERGFHLGGGHPDRDALHEG